MPVATDIYDTPTRGCGGCAAMSPKFCRSCVTGACSAGCAATGTLTMRSTAAASRSGALGYQDAVDAEACQS